MDAISRPIRLFFAIGVAVVLLPTNLPRAHAATGQAYDVSWPQCARSLPRNPAFVVIGVNHGRPFTTNPCIGAQYSWAKKAGAAISFYVNSANPGPGNTFWPSRGGAYQYGVDSARAAYEATARAVKVSVARRWWIDVETANSWSKDPLANVTVIQGMFDYLTKRTGTVAGIYSTTRNWRTITQNALALGVPSWMAGSSTRDAAIRMCTTVASVTGGPLLITQYPTGRFDGNYLCPRPGR